MNYGQRRGILDMRVVEARSLREPNYLSTSDPYAKVQIGATVHQTPVCQNGGRKPKWDAKVPPMIVPNIDADILQIELWDKDRSTSDDFIGKCAINIGQSLSSLQVTDAWYPVAPRGEIRLRTKFTPDGNHGANPAPAVPAAVAQPQLAQAGKLAFQQIVGVAPSMQPMAAAPGQMYAVDVDGDGRPDYIAVAPAAAAAPVYAAPQMQGQGAYHQHGQTTGQPVAYAPQPGFAPQLIGQPVHGQPAIYHQTAVQGQPAYGAQPVAYTPQPGYVPQPVQAQAYGQPVQTQVYGQPVQAQMYG